jgi:hypothetical protein
LQFNNSLFQIGFCRHFFIEMCIPSLLQIIHGRGILPARFERVCHKRGTSSPPFPPFFPPLFWPKRECMVTAPAGAYYRRENKTVGNFR